MKGQWLDYLVWLKEAEEARFANHALRQFTFEFEIAAPAAVVKWCLDNFSL